MGTPPASMIMEGTYLDPVDGTQRYFCIAPSQAAVRMPNAMHLGGGGLGFGEFILGRDQDNAGLATIRNDGRFLELAMPNGVKIPQPGGGQGWRMPLWLGSNALWADAAGVLRIKAGFPTGDTDGAVVGRQS
jgi:hypothetical protein